MDAGCDRVDADIHELRHELGAMRLALLQVGGGVVVGMIGLVAS